MRGDPFQNSEPVDGATMPVRVVEVRDVGAGFRTCELEGVQGALPEFVPGAYVDVHLPSGRVRQYSLCGPAGPRYEIGVLLLPGGRGGSREVHESLRVGEVLKISAPRNNFALVPAERYRLVSGGIGLPPLLGMAHDLHARGAEFALYICVRQGAPVPFGAVLDTLPFAPAVHLHVSGPAGFDPGPAVGEFTAGSVLYLCGPPPFMDSLGAAAAAQGWPADVVHQGP